MSDPVTNAEVEDVLSSIRRLVSEDKRPPLTQKETAPSDRLVLTPSLRVAEDPGKEARDDRSSFSSSIDAIAKAVSDPQWARGEGSGDFPKHDVPPEATSDEGLADEDEFEAQLSAELSILDTAADTVAEVSPQSDDVLELDRDMSGFPSDEPIAAPSADLDTANDTVMEKRPAEATDVAFHEVPDEEDDLVVPARDTATGLKSASLSAKIEALEAAIGKIPDTWEPDSAGESDFAGTEANAMAWEDNEPDEGPAPRLHFAPAAETARTAEQDALPHAEATDTPDSDPIGIRDDELIDEDALRDLVSEIVRAELQGDLGMRITRNVRKLVRREIHRALTAQDLE